MTEPLAKRPVRSYRQIRGLARAYVRSQTKGWRISAAAREQAALRITSALYELEILREEATHRGR
jgi:hypothetical protein